MPDVCLIPVFDRAELLHHCLRNIEKADGAQDILFLFKPDHGTKPEVMGVMGAFKLNFGILPNGDPPRIPRLMKQSWNMLTGYGMAASEAGEGGLVYMVESDVMVAPDFFEWPKRVNATHQIPFCCIASADTNDTAGEHRRQANISGSGDFYYSTSTYRSIGVCWRAQILHDLIAPHCTPGYFLNPHAYLKSNFPINPWGTTWCEQDGLIRRIQINTFGRSTASVSDKMDTMLIAYPFEPKCYHAGYYGGNRGNTRHAPKGSLQQRIEQVGRVIYSPEEMRAHAPSEGFYMDSRPIPLAAEVTSA